MYQLHASFILCPLLYCVSLLKGTPGGYEKETPSVTTFEFLHLPLRKGLWEIPKEAWCWLPQGLLKSRLPVWGQMKGYIVIVIM